MENEARADHSVGRMLQVKGDFAAAEPLMRRSLEIYQQLRGPQKCGRGGSAPRACFAATSQRRRKRGRANYFAIRWRCTSAFAPDDPQVAEAYQKLGGHLMLIGKPDEAEPLLRRSIDIYRMSKGPADLRGIASAVGDLGLLLYRKGNTDASEPLLRESLDTWQKVPNYESYILYDISAIAQTLSQLHERRGDKPGATVHPPISFNSTGQDRNGRFRQSQ